MSAAARVLGGVALAGLVTAVAAGEADVVAVEVHASGAGRYDFDVTIRHADTGWDHYADAWEVLAADGTVLATRTLAHPHVDEQPFRRSLEGVPVPQGIAEVRIRGHDSVHGFGGAEVTVRLPSAAH